MGFDGGPGGDVLSMAAALRAHVAPSAAAMLRLQTSTPAQERNVLAACMATVNGLRPSEGADLRACDLRLELDLRHGPPSRGTAATTV